MDASYGRLSINLTGAGRGDERHHTGTYMHPTYALDLPARSHESRTYPGLKTWPFTRWGGRYHNGLVCNPRANSEVNVAQTVPRQAFTSRHLRPASSRSLHARETAPDRKEEADVRLTHLKLRQRERGRVGPRRHHLDRPAYPVRHRVIPSCNNTS